MSKTVKQSATDVQLRFGAAVWREWGTLSIPFDVLVRDKWFHGTAIWAAEEAAHRPLRNPIVSGQAWAELTNADAWSATLRGLKARGEMEQGKRGIR